MTLKSRPNKLVFLLTLLLFGALPGWSQKERFARPIPMGVSVSTTPSAPLIFAGTAGLLVQPASNPEYRLILSNNHVLGAVGPDLCPNSAPAGTVVLQPGTLDIGRDSGSDPFYAVGVVAGHVPINFSGINFMDAALAWTNSTFSSPQILNIGMPNATVDAGIIALPGMPVKKSGRTTGLTWGVVNEINVAALVSYGSCGVGLFLNQFSITPGTFSGPGDSGSAILHSATLKPVGLLFAGSTFETLANQILLVYLRLGIVPAGAPVSAVTQDTLTRQSQAMFTDARLQQLRAIQEREQASLFRLPGVHAVGIGRSEDGRGYSLVVYCRKSSPELRASVQRRLGSVEVRFKERPEFRAY